MRIISIVGCLSLVLFSTTVFAMRPPAYLGVHDWKNCVSSYVKHGSESVCLPYNKPLNCSHSSWHKLNRENSLSHCPRSHHKHHDNHGMGVQAPE